MSPSRCIRRKATLQLISFTPPSGFLQFTSLQNIRESFWRFAPVAMRRPIKSISSPVNSRPQYLITMSVSKKMMGVQNYLRGLHNSAFPGSLFHKRAWSSSAARRVVVLPSGQKWNLPLDNLFWQSQYPWPS